MNRLLRMKYLCEAVQWHAILLDISMVNWVLESILDRKEGSSSGYLDRMRAGLREGWKPATDMQPRNLDHYGI